MDAKNKEKKLPTPKVTFEQAKRETNQSGEEVMPLSKTKSLMSTLDRFLAKKFFSIVVFFFATLAVCGTVLVVSRTTISHASSGGESSSTGLKAIDVWMYSIIAVVGFFLLLTVVFFLTRRKKKGKANENA